jgi:putative copper export protein
MNKKFLLVLAIIFMVMGVMGTDAYSWSRQNVKRQKEETAGWITSSVWTDWNEGVFR